MVPGENHDDNAKCFIKLIFSFLTPICQIYNAVRGIGRFYCLGMKYMGHFKSS